MENCLSRLLKRHVGDEMKVTKSQLRRLVREELTILEGNKPYDRSRKTRKAHSKTLTRRQGKAAAQHPEETEDTAVLGKGQLYKGRRMKTPSQLSYGLDYEGDGFTGEGLGEVRKFVHDTLSEGTMVVQHQPYGGVSIEVDGEEKTVGDMVADLLDAGDDDIFQGQQGLNPRALDRLINAWSDGVGGSMLNWDSDIFPNNYSVDLDRVIRLWARRYNHNIEELEMEEW